MPSRVRSGQVRKLVLLVMLVMFESNVLDIESPSYKSRSKSFGERRVPQVNFSEGSSATGCTRGNIHQSRRNQCPQRSVALSCSTWRGRVSHGLHCEMIGLPDLFKKNNGSTVAVR